MQLFRIIEGWGNYLTKDQKTEELATERAIKCSTCQFNQKSKVFSWVSDEIEEINASVCVKCSCPIAMKVRSKKEKCPVGKW